MNIDSIVNALVDKGMDPDHALEAVMRYTQFLDTAKQHPRTTLVPTKQVDEAWHAHLDMDSYRADCIAHCGTVLTHVPGVFGTPAWEAAYTATRTLVPYEMASDPYANSPLAGAECWEPGEDPEDPLTIKTIA